MFVLFRPRFVMKLWVFVTLLVGFVELFWISSSLSVEGAGNT